MSNRLSDLLASRPYLIADGATGTNLFAAGLATGEAPDLWVEQRPDEVIKLHRSFIDAGSDVVLSNSFGGTRYRLKLHGADGRVQEINRRAAELAREAADRAGRPVVVAGSMGPTGELIEPLGQLSFEACIEAYAEQAAGLAAGGADILWLETLSSPEELKAAALGASSAGPARHRHPQLRHQRPHHDGHHARGRAGAVPRHPAAARRVRRQLRRRARRSSPPPSSASPRTCGRARS